MFSFLSTGMSTEHSGSKVESMEKRYLSKASSDDLNVRLNLMYLLKRCAGAWVGKQVTGKGGVCENGW